MAKRLVIVRSRGRFGLASLGLLVLSLLISTARAQTTQSSVAKTKSDEERTTQCVPDTERLLTVEDHFERFGCGFIRWQGIVQTFGAPVATAGFSQLLTDHAGYSGDWSGFGKHYGVDLLGGVSSKFLGQFALPAAFHQDDRYLPARTGTPVLNRIGSILKHAILTRPATDTGHDVFNVAAIPNSLLNAALSNTYQPAVERTATASAERFAWSVGGYVAGDAAAEFSPELTALGKAITTGLGKIFHRS